MSFYLKIIPKDLDNYVTFEKIELGQCFMLNGEICYKCVDYTGGNQKYVNLTTGVLYDSSLITFKVKRVEAELVHKV